MPNIVLNVFVVLSLLLSIALMAGGILTAEKSKRESVRNYISKAKITGVFAMVGGMVLMGLAMRVFTFEYEVDNLRHRLDLSQKEVEYQRGEADTYFKQLQNETGYSGKLLAELQKYDKKNHVSAEVEAERKLQATINRTLSINYFLHSAAESLRRECEEDCK